MYHPALTFPCRPSSLAGAGAVLLLLANVPGAHAAPQAPDISIVLRGGDTLPNGDTLLGFRSPQISSAGRWGTIAGVAGPGLGTNVLIVDGQVVLKVGDALGNGDTLVRISEFSISTSGEVALLFGADTGGAAGTVGRLRVGSNIVISEGDTLAGTGDVVTDILGFDYDDGGLLLRVMLASPGGPDLQGSVFGFVSPTGDFMPQVVNRAGDAINGSALPLLTVGDELQVSSDASVARTAIPVSLSGPAGPVNALISNGVVVAEDGRPGPFTGSTWSFPTTPRAHAHIALPDPMVVGQLVDTVGTSQSVIFRGSAAIAMEGISIGATGLTAGSFVDASITLASDGTPIYTIPTASGSQVTMAGQELLIETGVTRASGWIIQDLNALIFGQYFGATDDGRELLQIVRLAGGDQALIRVDRGIDDPVVCPVVANSTGDTGTIRALGSRVLGDNNLTVAMQSLPTASFGYLLTSEVANVVMNPGGSQGNLCLGGDIGRFVDQVQSSGVSGTIITTIDLTAVPQPNGSVAAMAGESWLFQGWHRDSVMGTPTSNFTSAISVTLQ